MPSLWKHVKEQYTTRGRAICWTRRKIILLLLVALYALTWLFGVPSVDAARHRVVVQANMRGLQWLEDSTDYPIQRTFHAAPILPCVVVSHCYERVDTFGFDRVAIDLWYGLGSLRLFAIPLGWTSFDLI